MALKEALLRATVGAAMVALTGGAALAAGVSVSGSTAPSAGVHVGAGANAGTSAGTGGADLKSGANANAGTSAAPMGKTNADEDAAAGAGAKGSASTAMNNKPATPPKSLVGNDVINPKGEKIGEVSKISGDQLIVSSGGFLGIGSHDVAIPWSQFTMEGTGDKAKLQLSMTKDELKQMPEYKEPKASGGATGSAGASGGMGGSK